MTFNPDDPREHEHEKPWVISKALEANVPVKLTVLDVTPMNDEDTSFFMNCMIHDGELKGKTTRIYWWRTKKSGQPRNDFTSLVKALLPDRHRNSMTIHSFHFKDKCFVTTPKDFGNDDGSSMRIFVKVREIELDVRGE
jgi:hypothetical protein